MPVDPTTGVSLYNIGDLLRLQVTFTDINGSLADPTSITLKIKNPVGTVTTYTYPAQVLKSSTGVYYFDYAVVASGTHYFNWAGTGAYTAADEGSFTVITSVF